VRRVDDLLVPDAPAATAQEDRMNLARLRLPAIALLLASALAVTALAGCAMPPATTTSVTATGTATSTPDAGALQVIKIGALPNEDSLSLWVAANEGLFRKVGLDVQITTFPSAAERDAALQAGSVDAVSGDIIAAALLAGHGFPVKIVTLQLGGTPAEGRFGILANPKSGVKTLADLTTKGPLAQSSGTLAAYSADQMLVQAGIKPDSVKRSEVKKLPVRFQLLQSNQVPAAVLPEPLLTLGQKEGLTLLADDTKGPQNISQTVLIFSDKYLKQAAAAKTIPALLNATDEAAAAINATPDAFRALLVEKARLPKPIAETYKISHYPAAAPPTAEQVDSVLTWMRAKKLVGADVTYETLVQGK
jgi:NitT/TauT family transport system substrate-binding protein